MTSSPIALTGCRVLVTGASGFLGLPLCRALIREGANVFGISRSHSLAVPGSFEYLRIDLSDYPEVEHAFHHVRPDIVFHLTGHSVGSPELANVLPTFRNDLTPTVSILNLAAQSKCKRIILAASLEEPIPGTGDITPSSPYAASKWAGGAYARMFHKLYGTPVVITRPFMTYGPGQKEHKLIPHIILSLLRGQSPQLSSGAREVDWIFLDDVIRGFLAAGSRPDVEGCNIDLGTGILVSIRSMVEQLVKLLPSAARPVFGGIQDRPVEQVRVADTSYGWQKLGWRAEVPLEKGLQQTIEWYRRALIDSAVESTSLYSRHVSSGKILKDDRHC
jgi:UDP-glucose 4-epimerase